MAKKQIVRVIIHLAGVSVSLYSADWNTALKNIGGRLAQFPNAKIAVSKGSYATIAIVNITVPGVS